jgi:hypothetical protein
MRARPDSNLYPDQKIRQDGGKVTAEKELNQGLVFTFDHPVFKA